MLRTSLQRVSTRQTRPHNLIRSQRYFSNMSLAEFVSAAEQADPTLVGSSEKDKEEITQLSSEVGSLAKDLKVRMQSPGS